MIQVGYASIWGTNRGLGQEDCPAQETNRKTQDSRFVLQAAQEMEDRDHLGEVQGEAERGTFPVRSYKRASHFRRTLFQTMVPALPQKESRKEERQCGNGEDQCDQRLSEESGKLGSHVVSERAT